MVLCVLHHLSLSYVRTYVEFGEVLLKVSSVEEFNEIFLVFSGEIENPP